MTRRSVLIGLATALGSRFPLHAGAQEVPVQVTMHEISFACEALGLRPDQCSDRLLARLGHGPAFRLKADAPTDTVHGSVSIRHTQPPGLHLIRVEVYQADLGPRGGRQSTLRRPPGPLPDAATIQRQLETRGPSE